MQIIKEQWKQFQKNIEEATNSCIIVELKLDEYEEKERFYIDWVDEEEVGLVPVSACLLGTLDELLYNYFGDEQQITLYLDEEENQQHRDILIQALFENKQVPIRYFVVNTAYEDTECLEVAILENPPKEYLHELVYKDGKYEIKQ